MKKVRTSLRRCVCIVLCLLLFAAVLPVSAFAECAETKTVRAGWYEDACNITGEHGERSGYGYEYEQAVAAYTGWSYEYVRNDWANLLEMMGNGEIDCVVSTETPAWVEFGMSAIAVTGGTDIYFAINKDRPDLKEELDSAMRKMEQDKPFYSDTLYQRYLSAVSMPVPSSEEKAWLEQHGALKIGFLKQDPGISMLEEGSGKLTGVLTDYSSLAKDSLGDQTLEFELHGFDTLEEEIDALKNEDIDFIFHFTQNPYIAEESGFVLSNTVLAFNLQHPEEMKSVRQKESK